MVNRETVPFDNKNFNNCNGIRIGVPAITTLGLKEDDMDNIFYFIDKTLGSINNNNIFRICFITTIIIKKIIIY